MPDYHDAGRCEVRFNDADRRLHGTTGEAPLVRFQRDEAALAALDGRLPFGHRRELVRRVQADCAVAVDGNSYSVPWRLIGESVRGAHESVQRVPCRQEQVCERQNG